MMASTAYALAVISRLLYLVSMQYHMHVCVSSAKNLKRGAKLHENNFKPLLIPLIILFAVATLDQVTKIWAINYLSQAGSVKVLGDFFMLTLVYNEGGALGSNLGPSLVYLIISILILGLVLFYIYNHRDSKSLSFSLSFIAGGALGNIIDRLRIGKVVDWIDIDFIDLNLFGYQLDRWWTFNIADAAISCAIVFILAGLFFSNTKFGQRDNNKQLVDTKK